MTPPPPPLPVGRFCDIGDGLRIHYHEAGAGHPLVFIHGSGPGASGWSNFHLNQSYFASRGFRCLIPDTLGFGLSSMPEDAEYHLDWLVNGVQRFLSALGIDRFSLVGNSLGGAMCIRLALNAPERVNKMVLMAPGGLEPRERYFEMKGIRTMLRAVFAEEGISRESMRRVFQLQLWDPALITEELIEERLAVALTQPKRVFETLTVPNLVDQLPNLQCPILALWGMNDQFCPPSGAWTLANACPDVRVMTLSRCGHWVMVERPSLFNATTLQFLVES